MDESYFSRCTVNPLTHSTVHDQQKIFLKVGCPPLEYVYLSSFVFIQSSPDNDKILQYLDTVHIDFYCNLAKLELS